MTRFLTTDMVQQILHQSSDKIVVIDPAYELKYFNPSAQKHALRYGIKQLELGTNVRPYVGTNFWKKAFDKAFSGETLEFKKQYIIGEHKYDDLVSILPLVATDGQIEAVVLQAKNLNVEPYTSEDILENENLFQSLFRYSPVGITIRKLKTQELKAFNKKICEMFECTPADFKGYVRSDFIHYEDTALIEKNMQLLTTQKIKSFRLEKQYKRKNGEIFWGLAHRSSFEIGGEMYQMGIIENINKQKKFEAELIKKEANTQAIFNSTTDKVFAIGKNYQLIDANLSALQILAKFNLHKDYREVDLADFDFRQYQFWLPYIESAFEGKESNFERNYHFAGEDQTDLVTVSPLRDEVGDIIGASVYGKPITEIKKIQQALKASQALLLEAERIAKVGHWEFEVATQKISWSSSVATIFDLQLDEINSLEKFRNYVHPEDHPSMKRAVENAITTKAPYEILKRIIHKNKKPIYVIARGEPFVENGKVTKLFGTIQDITQLKAFEKDVRNTNEKYRNLFDNVYDAIVVTNEEGKLVDVNRAAEKLTGYSKKEMSALRIRDIVHPDDLEKSNTYLQTLREKGYYSDYQGRIINKDGTVKYVQVNSNAIYDNGKIVGSRDIVRDISQLKEAEQKREQLLQELEKVNQELREFAYIVSHDLKAPLRAINAISSWLAEDYKDVLDEKGQQQLQLLSNRVNRMHQFINGIFEYTKLGRTTETKEVVDLNQLIDNIFLMLNLGEDTTIHIPKKLPELYCERIKVEQIFLNLISNATKHNDKEICLLAIEYDDLGSHYAFRVSDNGKGIDEKNFDRIFQIFQTLQPKDNCESTGIGLSIVKKIVQLHEGDITVKSELGKGTTFEFTLKKYKD
ncbi:MAG: PAS domain S-box protein [Bacteroidota bacterium]